MPPAHTISQQSLSSDEFSTDHFCIRFARAEDFAAIHKLIVMLAIDSEMAEKVKTTPEQLKQDFLHSRFSALVIERLDQTGLLYLFYKTLSIVTYYFQALCMISSATQFLMKNTLRGRVAFFGLKTFSLLNRTDIQG